MTLSLTSVFLTFAAGIGSVLSPCVFPVLGVVVTGTERDHKYRPLLVVAGLAITFMLMGIVTSAFGAVIGSRLLYIEKAAGLLIVALGVLMLIDVNFFKKLTFFQQFHSRSNGTWSGLLLGLTLGIVWIPCVGPMLSSVLAMVATEGQLTIGAFMLAVYSLGFAVPMLVIGYSSQWVRTKMRSLGKNAAAFRIGSGIIIILLGLNTLLRGVL